MTMTLLVEALRDRVVGSVEEVSPDQIVVGLGLEAPQTTALGSGFPMGFPKINGYVLIPNERGATVGTVTSVRIQRAPLSGGASRQDRLVDLPVPSRVANVTPLGTLTAEDSKEGVVFRVQRGLDVFPSVGDPVVLPSIEQINAIVAGSSNEDRRILIGQSPVAASAPVYADPDRLFGRHLAVLGNTGAGKSCSVAGLIRWSLEAAKKSSPTGNANARFILLDPNGEYARAFPDQQVRLFQVEPEADSKPLKVPAWLWNGEEWSAFSGASPGVQRPILLRALRSLRSGAGAPESFQVDAIGRLSRYAISLRAAIVERSHQTAGRREGVAELLANLEHDLADHASRNECETLGLRERFEGAAATAREVEEGARGQAKNDGGYWHSDFREEELQGLAGTLDQLREELGGNADAAEINEDIPLPFEVERLTEFVRALASDSAQRDLAQFVDSLNLRIRGLLVRGRLGSVVRPEDALTLTLEQWLSEYIGDHLARSGPIAVIDLSLVPSEVVHVVVAVLGRMVFEAVQRYRRLTGNELPTVMVLEEAHTFLHRDLSSDSASAAGAACYRVFERIAREGRKFGLGLVLASQRPSEISPTVLSQCNTFLLHRLVNDQDQQLVRRLLPEGLGGLLRELPSLPSRRAVLLGWASAAPTLVEMRELPKEWQPHSPDPAFWRVWTGQEDRPIEWNRIAAIWQGRADPGPGEAPQPEAEAAEVALDREDEPS